MDEKLMDFVKFQSATIKKLESRIHELESRLNLPLSQFHHPSTISLASLETIDPDIPTRFSSIGSNNSIQDTSSLNRTGSLDLNRNNPLDLNRIELSKRTSSIAKNNRIDNTTSPSIKLPPKVETVSKLETEGQKLQSKVETEPVQKLQSKVETEGKLQSKVETEGKLQSKVETEGKLQSKAGETDDVETPSNSVNVALNRSEDLLPLSSIQENALDFTKFKIALKKIEFHQNQKKFVFLLSDKITGVKLFSIAKTFEDFYALEQQLESSVSVSRISKIPEEVWEKLDMEKSSLIETVNEYASHLLALSEIEPEISEFFSTNICPIQTDPLFDFRKKGFLFKKGKALGGWKLRYYMIEKSNGIMYYGESPHLMLGPIADLNYSCVARQPPMGEKSGLVIIQYKKQSFNINSPNPTGTFDLNSFGLPEGKVDSKHILFAESEQERDEWVRCIAGQISVLRPNDSFNNRELEQVTMACNKKPAQSANSTTPNNVSISPQSSTKMQETKAPSPDKPHHRKPSIDTSIIAPPTATSTPTVKSKNLPDMVLLPTHDKPYPIQSNPAKTRKASVELHDMPSSKSNAADKSNLNIKRTPEPIKRAMTLANDSSYNSSIERHKTANYIDDQEKVMAQDFPPSLFVDSPLNSTSNSKDAQKAKKKGNFMKDWLKKKGAQNSDGLKKQLFGLPLEDALTIRFIPDYPMIPFVIYRCIEYLESKHAYEEEGLYRLSGSASVISNLRQRFDNEDVNLLEDGVSYDVHAIAGVLKLYLRELPNPILSKDLRSNFFHITGTLQLILDISGRNHKVEELNRLVHLLPQVNYTTLKILLAHLIRVVKNCEKNKMNLRNISIVFSPTLGIPAGIFNLMMAEYPTLFSDTIEPENVQIETSPTDKDIGAIDALRSWEAIGNSPPLTADQKKRSEKRRPILNAESPTREPIETRQQSEELTNPPSADLFSVGIEETKNILDDLANSLV